MARLTIGQKSARLLTFLMGFRKQQVVAQLAPYGFDQAALDEGWMLLRRVVGERLNTGPLAPIDSEVARLDAWENKWFPIAAAVLRRHAPEIHDKVFHNLTQTQGVEVVLSVDTFLARLDELAADPGAGTAALTVLQRHGLTPAVVSEARQLIAQTTSVPAAQEPEPEPVDDLAQREAQMWDYYLQWSAIARVAITDRRMLRSLGFLKLRRNGNGSSEDNGEDNIEPGDDAGILDGQLADQIAGPIDGQIAGPLDDSDPIELAPAQ